MKLEHDFGRLKLIHTKSVRIVIAPSQEHVTKYVDGILLTETGTWLGRWRLGRQLTE